MEGGAPLVAPAVGAEREARQAMILGCADAGGGGRRAKCVGGEEENAST